MMIVPFPCSASTAAALLAVATCSLPLLSHAAHSPTSLPDSGLRCGRVVAAQGRFVRLGLSVVLVINTCTRQARVVVTRGAHYTQAKLWAKRHAGSWIQVSSSDEGQAGGTRHASPWVSVFCGRAYHGEGISSYQIIARLYTFHVNTPDVVLC